jgi:hypothetical protein
VRQLVKDGRRFEGNEDEIKIYNSKGKLILIGKDHGDGFWSCHQSDLVKAYLERDSHYTAEDSERAMQAFELCEELGHCGDAAITSALDNGTFRECHLTSQDLRNAREIFGPCAACGRKDGCAKRTIVRLSTCDESW